MPGKTMELRASTGWSAVLSEDRPDCSPYQLKSVSLGNARN
jgi:hypothetical protein